MATRIVLGVFALLFLSRIAIGQDSSPASTGSQESATELLKQALAAYGTGQFDAAIEKYQNAIKQDPKCGDAYAGLTRTYLKQEKVQLAFETASKGSAEVPGSLPVHVALGEVYFRQAKMGESEKEFLAAVNTPHPDARAYLDLSRLYDAYSLHARARSFLEKAHRIDPMDPEIQRHWMRTLVRREQIEWLEKYLAAPTSSDEEQRRSFQTYLDVLKERQRQPSLNCRLGSNLTSTEAMLKPMMIDATHFRGFGLMVQVNGQSSKLLLDTGASGLLINTKLAQKGGIQPVVTTKFHGIGDKGEMGGYIGYADSIKIGGLEFQHCLVEVSDKRSILDEDGVIGTDVFSNYLVIIDFLWQKLKLEELPQRPGEKPAPATLASSKEDESDSSPTKEEKDNQEDKTPPSGGGKDADSAKAVKADSPHGPAQGPQDRYIAPEMQNYTRIFRFGHLLLIPTRVADAPSKLFLIDTGAMMNSISPQAAHEVTKVHGDNDMQIKGLSGSVKQVYSADKAMLQFSHFRQENQDLISFDLSGISKSAGTEISGILGFPTLRLFTLKIDYRDGLVDFVYTGPKQ